MPAVDDVSMVQGDLEKPAQDGKKSPPIRRFVSMSTVSILS